MSTVTERTEFFNNKFPDNRESADDPFRQMHLIMLRSLKVLDYICEKHDIKYWLEAGTLLGAIRHEGFIPWDDDIDVSMLREDFDKFIEVAPNELPEDIFMQTEFSDKGFYFRGVPLKLRDANSFIQERGDDLKDSFNRGIFIDVFPYDNLTSNKFLHWFRTYYTKKILKLKRAKIRSSRSTASYTFFSKFFSIKVLNKILFKVIRNANKRPSNMLTYGYDFSQRGVFPKDAIFPLTRAKFEGAEFPVPGDFDRFLTIKFGEYMKLPPKDQQKPKHTVEVEPILKGKDINSSV